jgi:hypothetical protein
MIATTPIVVFGTVGYDLRAIRRHGAGGYGQTVTE